MASEADKAPFHKRVWTQWRRAAHSIGVVQTRFIMLLIYVTVVVPTGVLMRISSDPLHLKKPDQTNCQPARQDERNIENARRQF